MNANGSSDDLLIVRRVDSESHRIPTNIHHLQSKRKSGMDQVDVAILAIVIRPLLSVPLMSSAFLPASSCTLIEVAPVHLLGSISRDRIRNLAKIDRSAKLA